MDEEKVAISEYQGKAMFVINPNSRFPFQFGLTKAKMLLDEDVLKALKTFVETEGKQI